jgi:4'-phosphopantetheinyl transferase EntD
MNPPFDERRSHHRSYLSPIRRVIEYRKRNQLLQTSLIAIICMVSMLKSSSSAFIQRCSQYPLTVRTRHARHYSVFARHRNPRNPPVTSILSSLLSSESSSPAPVSNSHILTGNSIAKYNHNSNLGDSSIATVLFDLDLPEGKCIALQLIPNATTTIDSAATDSDDSSSVHASCFASVLHPDEIQYGLDRYTSLRTRTSFYLGRWALRTALHSIGSKHVSMPLLKDDAGRPVVPHGYGGSISHKEHVGVALVAAVECNTNNNTNNSTTNQRTRSGIGIDLEYCNGSRSKIARKVLTEHERQSLGQLEVSTRCTCIDADCFSTE